MCHFRKLEVISVTSGPGDHFFILDPPHRISGIRMFDFIHHVEPERAIIFANRRDRTHKLVEYLKKKGIPCEGLAGDVPQKKRLSTLNKFKSGELKYLVATDVAGRGIHVDGVTHVINYELPDQVKVTVDKDTSVTIEGPDKQKVGMVAAELRGFYPVEPYKAKGVKYVGEHVRRKEGKTVQ